MIGRVGRWWCRAVHCWRRWDYLVGREGVVLRVAAACRACGRVYDRREHVLLRTDTGFVCRPRGGEGRAE